MDGLKSPKMTKKWGVWEVWTPPGDDPTGDPRRHSFRQNEFDTEAKAYEFLESRRVSLEKHVNNSLVRPYHVYCCVIKNIGDGMVWQLAEAQFDFEVGVHPKGSVQ